MPSERNQQIIGVGTRACIPSRSSFGLAWSFFAILENMTGEGMMVLHPFTAQTTGSKKSCAIQGLPSMSTSVGIGGNLLGLEWCKPVLLIHVRRQQAVTLYRRSWLGCGLSLSVFVVPYTKDFKTFF